VCSPGNSIHSFGCSRTSTVICKRAACPGPPALVRRVVNSLSASCGESDTEPNAFEHTRECGHSTRMHGRRWRATTEAQRWVHDPDRSYERSLLIGRCPTARSRGATPYEALTFRQHERGARTSPLHRDRAVSAALPPVGAQPPARQARWLSAPTRSRSASNSEANDVSLVSRNTLN
jgi:hypothetical protein